MSPLPPGQILTKQLWRVGESAPSAEANRDSWEIHVCGSVREPFVVSLAELMEMDQREFQMDVHCVTGWSCMGQRFTGLPVAELIKRARPRSIASFVRFEAYSDRRHDTSLPLDVAMKDSWLVHRLGGEELPVDRGGPLRVVTKGKYFYKSLKWVHIIEVLDEDVFGYWERESAYHNVADPFREERFDDARIATDHLSYQFRETEDFELFRDGSAEHVLIKARLGNWTPKSTNLNQLQLKACNFDSANLRGVSFRGANLTLSKFFRADLTNANFEGADLEGANFSGAILDGTQMIDVYLSATTFFQQRANGTMVGPKSLKGLRIRPAPASELLPEQKALLIDAGADVQS